MTSEMPAPHPLIPAAPILEAGSIGLAERLGVNYVNKYAGALLGVAVGDALGRPYEASRRTWFDVPPAELGQFKPWSGYLSGPLGTITDDTQMTICVAEWLNAAEEPTPERLAKKFVDWLPAGRGVGATCRRAVRNMIAEIRGTPAANHLRETARR